MEKTFTDSRSVKRINYSEETKILEVEFTTGTVYHYFDVPKDVMMEALKAESIGSFMNAHIKGTYEYKKIK